jgi:hypothetical protein
MKPVGDESPGGHAGQAEALHEPRAHALELRAERAHEQHDHREQHDEAQRETQREDHSRAAAGWGRAVLVGGDRGSSFDLILTHDG